MFRDVDVTLVETEEEEEKEGKKNVWMLEKDHRSRYAKCMIFYSFRLFYLSSRSVRWISIYNDRWIIREEEKKKKKETKNAYVHMYTIFYAYYERVFGHRRYII